MAPAIPKAAIGQTSPFRKKGSGEIGTYLSNSKLIVEPFDSKNIEGSYLLNEYNVVLLQTLLN